MQLQSMIVVMTLMSFLSMAVNASALGNILAVFEFLPRTQYNQLKPKIIQILQNRPPSSWPLYQQARSISSQISAAYKVVVSHGKVNARGRLMKRSTNPDGATQDGTNQDGSNHNNGGFKETPKESSAHPTMDDIPDSFRDIPDLAQQYGFLDIFSLNVEELTYLHEMLTQPDPFGMYYI